MASNRTARAEYIGSSGTIFPVIDVLHFGEARVDVATYRRTNEIGRMFWLIRKRLAGISAAGACNSPRDDCGIPK